MKAIRSLRLWEYETFRTHDVLHVVCMATEDDLKANAEYIRLADEFITVEGGSNRNNYANVDLIVKVARRCEADAVWPGWGHASENPKLPAALQYHDIAFLGPSAAGVTGPIKPRAPGGEGRGGGEARSVHVPRLRSIALFLEGASSQSQSPMSDDRPTKRLAV